MTHRPDTVAPDARTFDELFETERTPMRVGTVKSSLHRALAQLREELAP